MEKQNCFYVYIMFRPWDGSPCYVGKGYGNRWLCHEKVDFKFHSNKHLVNIIKKARRLGLDIPKIKVQENLIEVSAHKIEIAFIKAIGRKDLKLGPLVNKTNGGEGTSGFIKSNEVKNKHRAPMFGNQNALGSKHSKETILKMSNYQSNRTQLHRQRLGLAFKGKILSKEHKDKLRAAKIGKKQKPEVIAKRAKSNTGKKRTQETKDKISKALIGNPKLKSMLGKHHTDETKLKMSKVALKREAKKRVDKPHQLQ